MIGLRESVKIEKKKKVQQSSFKYGWKFLESAHRGPRNQSVGSMRKEYLKSTVIMYLPWCCTVENDIDLVLYLFSTWWGASFPASPIFEEN